MDLNNQYPKELVTFERTIEGSDEVTKLITVVYNEYEEAAVNVIINYQNAHR